LDCDGGHKLKNRFTMRVRQVAIEKVLVERVAKGLAGEYQASRTLSRNQIATGGRKIAQKAMHGSTINLTALRFLHENLVAYRLQLHDPCILRDPVVASKHGSRIAAQENVVLADHRKRFRACGGDLPALA